MTKEKLPTREKSKKCSISKCPHRSVITISFGIEKRKLCQEHYNQLMRKDSYFEVIITKASTL